MFPVIGSYWQFVCQYIKLVRLGSQKPEWAAASLFLNRGRSYLTDQMCQTPPWPQSKLQLTRCSLLKGTASLRKISWPTGTTGQKKRNIQILFYNATVDFISNLENDFCERRWAGSCVGPHTASFFCVGPRADAVTRVGALRKSLISVPGSKLNGTF